MATMATIVVQMNNLNNGSRAEPHVLLIAQKLMCLLVCCSVLLIMKLIAQKLMCGAACFANMFVGFRSPCTETGST